MSGQVMFLNRHYHPTEEERDHLEEIQVMLHYANIEYLQHYRDLPKDELKMRKDMAHIQARQAIGIIPKSS